MPERTEKIMEVCLFQHDVMILPSKNEMSKEEISNRTDPSICIVDQLNEETMEIVLQCNTVRSVDKLRNVLDSHQTKEKAALISGLSNLDDDFQTIVYQKLKPYNFGQSPSDVKDRTYTSRTISERVFDQLFARVDEIRKEGLEKREANRRDPPKLPMVGIAQVNIPRNEGLFCEKLRKLKPLYEATLGIKTRVELNKIARQEQKIKVFDHREPDIMCEACNDRTYTREEYRENRFCRTCNNRLSLYGIEN